MSPKSLGIHDSIVYYRGMSGGYVVGIDVDGIHAAPTEVAGTVPDKLHAFDICWSDIGSVEQRWGFFFWGIIFQLKGTDERCEAWMLYERFHPTAFRQIQEEYSALVTVQSAGKPNWKIVALPLGLTFLWAGLAALAYLAGYGALAVLLGFAAVVSLIYTVWVMKRPR